MPDPLRTTLAHAAAAPGPHPRLDAILDLFTGDDPPTPVIRATLRQRFIDFQSRDHLDLPAFWDILQQTVAASGWTPPVHDGPRRLLVTACGRCEEAVTLAAFFSQLDAANSGGSDTGFPATNLLVASASLPVVPVELTGIDVRENSLEKARRRCHSTRSLFEKALHHPSLRHRFAFRFLCLDATTIETRPEFAVPFDVLLFRHQNMYQGMGLWTKIFEQSLTRLHPEGLVVITSYYDEEHRRAMEVMSALGMTLLATRRNPNSRPLKRAGQSMDRHVAAFVVPGCRSASGSFER